MAKTLFGHDIPYVLPMHVGALDAELLPQLLKLYRDSGFTFVSLEDAEKDAFYRNDVDLSLPAGVDSLEGAIREKGLSLPGRAPLAVDGNAVCR